MSGQFRPRIPHYMRWLNKPASTTLIQLPASANTLYEEEKPVVCPARANGYESSGAHQCQVCDIPVHALNACSLSVYESSEGFGEKRISIQCFNTSKQPRSQKK